VNKAMYTLVIYDITEDDIRTKVSDVCKRFGLTRIQKSAFMGQLTSAARKELAAALRRVFNDANGNIQIFVICRADLSLRTVIGKPYEEYSQEAEGILV